MPGNNIVNLTPEVMASWPAPNYDHPSERTWLPVFSCIWFAAATSMVAMRFWLRLRGHAGKLGLDDAILLPGWVASAMFTAATLLYNFWAQGGRHIWDIEENKRQNLALSLWLAEISFLACGGLTKISVLLFYRRLVDGTYRKLWKWLVLLAISFTTSYSIAFIVILFFNCTPMVAYWRALDPAYAATTHYTCLNTDAANLIAGICAALSDMYAVALPCIITWHYAVPRRQQIALNVVFSFGLIVVAASGVRTYYLIMTSVKPDVSRTFFNLIVWAQLELQLGIMCASAPSLRGFFKRYLGGSMSSHALKSGDTPSGPNSKGSVLANAFHRKGNNAYSVNEITLETSIESKSVHRAWSATPSREHLTRSSTEGESIPLEDMWKNPGLARYDVQP